MRIFLLFVFLLWIAASVKTFIVYCKAVPIINKKELPHYFLQFILSFIASILIIYVSTKDFIMWRLK